MSRYVAAIDQGTTSSRCLVFDRRGAVVGQAQREHRQHYPQAGWVEHDPLEIWQTTLAVVREALAAAGATAGEVAALGITNQRETTVVWDPTTGRPWLPAIVWQDTRTRALCDELAAAHGEAFFRDRTGLPPATYFSGPKLRWALDHTPGLRQAAEQGRALAGTMDSWLIWNLTGGPAGGRHVTDVTNASRTLLLNLATRRWDDDLLGALGLPRRLLPEVVPSSSATAFGTTRADGPLGAAIPIASALGDQQAALFGQCCFAPGEAKCTYGTGCFLLLHTGPQPVPSRHGLLTTIAGQFGAEPVQYALEGSVAIAGALVQWLRDNLGLIASSAELEPLARQVPDSAGLYFVPAFSGLFAPHWRSDARGVLVGLTHYTTRAHLARAVVDATAYQTRDLLAAMHADTGLQLAELKVDGGMTRNALLMQFQADLLGLPVVRPRQTETTALGAAFAAGLATGFWTDRDELRHTWQADSRWTPQLAAADRDRLVAGWQRALERSFDLA